MNPPAKIVSAAELMDIVAGKPLETQDFKTQDAREESPLARRARELREQKQEGQMPEAREEAVVLPTGMLKPHPMLARVSMLSELIEREERAGRSDGEKRQVRKERASDLAERLAVIRESIRHAGIRTRLKVCRDAAGNWLIVDGRHRQAIALELGIEALTCEVVAESEAPAIIMAAVTSRPMSKGAIAYLAVLTHPEVATSGRGGDRRSNRTECGLIVAEKLAAKVGVSLRLVEDAMWLYRAFDEREDAREKFEPSVWVGAGLHRIKGAVEAFLKGDVAASEDEEEMDHSPSAVGFRRYIIQLDAVKTSWGAWEKLGPERQKAAVRMTCLQFKQAPPELRAALLDTLKELI